MASEKIKEDRRIKRTKSLLKQGLIELMKEKSVQKITVKELVERVDINRSTFYLHYEDIYDLLEEIEDTLMSEIMAVCETYSSIENLEESYAFLLTLFQTFEHNRDLCKILVNINGSSHFTQKMEETLEDKIRIKLDDLLGDSSVIPAQSYIFYRCGCIGLLRYWITTDSPESSEEMAKKTYHLVVDSLLRLQKNQTK